MLEKKPFALNVVNFSKFYYLMITILLFAIAIIISPSILRGIIPIEFGLLSFVFLVSILFLKIFFSGVNLNKKGFFPSLIFVICNILISIHNQFIHDISIFISIIPACLVIIFIFIESLSSNSMFRIYFLNAWKFLFYITALSAILTYISSHFLPSIFNSYDFSNIYIGQADRKYEISFLGAYILESYNSNTINIHRSVGFLAEPGMMSFFFIFNTYLALIHRGQLKSKLFGFLNLTAGLTCHSYTFVISGIVILILYFFLNKNIFLRFFVFPAFIILMIIFFLDFNFFEFSSLDNRLRSLDYIINLIPNHPAGLLFGFAIFVDNYEYLSGTHFRLLFDNGLFVVLIYYLFIFRKLKNRIEIFCLFLLYSISLPVYSYFIFSLAMIAFLVCDHTFHNRNKAGISIK